MKWIRAVVMILLSLALLLGSIRCGTDTSSPTTPSNLTRTTPCNNNLPTFTWNTASDEGSGISRYLINIDGNGWWTIGDVTTYTYCCNPLSDGSHTFEVKAVDKAGNEGSAASLIFIIDTIPPNISGVSTSGIDTSSCTITWTTDEPASSEVEYGLTSAYGSNTTVDSTLVTSHSVKVTGLEPNTIYNYRVRSIDSCGNEALSGDQSVTTPGTKPIAANVSVYCIGDSLTAAGYYEAELKILLGASCTVVNQGIGGDTTTGMLSRFKTSVLDHNPDFVVIWGGVNDIDWAGISLDTTKSNLQSMYTQAHNAGISVIAISMSPWKGCTYW